MWNKHFKLAMAIIMMICICGIFSASVYAKKGTYVLNGGVGNYGNNRRYYYIDSSCNSAGVDQVIRAAWSDWINTTVYTPISTRETTTKSQSCFDFYYNEFESFTTLNGITHFYLNSGSEVTIDYLTLRPSANWDWTNININSSNYLQLSTNQNNMNYRKYVVAHEIGHAMGLVHADENSTDVTIMHRSTNSANTDICSQIDLEDINQMY